MSPLQITATRLRRRLLVVGALIVLPAVLWKPLLQGMAAFMAAASPLEKAAVILPLYQDESIPAAVLDLYRRGYASRVLLHRTVPGRLEKLGLVSPPLEVWQGLLESRGVPAANIVIIDQGVSGDEELGRALGAFAKGDPMRVIVVAASPASRLSRNALREGLNDSSVDLLMHPVTPGRFEHRPWWRTRAGWISYFDAYCLWLLRFLR